MPSKINPGLRMQKNGEKEGAKVRQPVDHIAASNVWDTVLIILIWEQKPPGTLAFLVFTAEVRL